MPRIATLLLALCAAAAVAHASEELGVEVTHLPEDCEFKTRAGDQVQVHYTGKLEDGSVFDSSVERGEPITFMLGEGEVIAGWDQGIDGMCVGEKRQLTIPPELGYGETGYPPVIPGNAVLHFEVELINVTPAEEVQHHGHDHDHQEHAEDDEDGWAQHMQDMNDPEMFNFQEGDFEPAEEEAVEGEMFADN